MKQCKNNEGFSLIELTVVMVIIGLLMAGVFAYLNVNLQQKKIDNTLDHTKQNLASLQDFITKDLVNAAGQKVDRAGNVLAADAAAVYEHRLPCPATPGLKPGDPDFGVEQCPPGGATYKGVRVATGTAGERVFIGAYPSATLQTYGENSVDGYRGAYVYAVTKSLTDKALEPVQTGKEPGAVIVNYIDKNGATTTYPNKPFALISTGENGTSASASNVDFENTNGDATFLAQENRSSNPDFFYDDRVSFGFTESAELANCPVASLDVQQFTENRTWTKPENASYAVVEIWGSQGGSDGCTEAGASKMWSCSSPPGATGGYAKTILSASQLNSLSGPVNIVIGIGGDNAKRASGGGIYVAAKNGTPTCLGDCASSMIRLSGGKRSATTGTSTGADFFGTTLLGGNTSISSNAVAPTCGNNGDPEEGGSGERHYVVWCGGGKGSDGAVVITTYLCQ